MSAASTSLTVIHMDGDSGNFIIGNTFDKFRLILDKTELFEAHFEYSLEGDEYSTRYTLKILTPVCSAELPGVNSDLDLLGKLQARLDELADEAGHEFYVDLFSGDADTPDVTLTLTGEFYPSANNVSVTRGYENGGNFD